MATARSQWLSGVGHDMLFSEKANVGGCADAASPAGLRVENLGVETPAGILLLRSLTFALPSHGLTALIGPEAAGKTVLLRALLRLSDQVDGLRLHGRVFLHEQPILAPGIEVDREAVRRQLGWVPSVPGLLPTTLHDHLTYGLRLRGETDQGLLDGRVEAALRRCGLWTTLADVLHRPGVTLNGERCYLLALARVLMLEPRVLLLDVPGVSLSPGAIHHLESLLHELQHDHAILMATHDLSQAARLSEACLFLRAGELIEYGQTDQMFICPDRPETEHYLAGRYGPMRTNNPKKWRKHGSR